VPHESSRCEGTGFRLGRDLFVTCWHCVSSENHEYVLSLGEVDPDSSGAVLYPLHDVAQDANGSDLATARLDDELFARGQGYAVDELVEMIADVA
jgi:hypothetical protein